MARTADHELRRTQIAEAVHRLLADAGPDAATMAAVAREAGFSVGLVQHYFQSKDDLLLFAYQHMMSNLLGRVEKQIANGEAAKEAIAENLLKILPELLPLDKPQRGEYRVTRAFLSRSLDNAEVAKIARQSSAMLRDRLAQAVTNGKECGEVESEVDADLAGTRIAALLDGLADQLYSEPNRKVGKRPLSRVAVEILGSCLGEIFTGECRHHR